MLWASRNYYQLAQLKVILELFCLLVSWCAPETEAAAKSYFHSLPPSVSWYLLMQQYLG